VPGLILNLDHLVPNAHNRRYSVGFNNEMVTMPHTLKSTGSIIMPIRKRVDLRIWRETGDAV
jgi:hypothetical protein